MSEVTPETFITTKVHPLDGMPDSLKDPRNYMKIQRALLETLACGKSHSDLLAMSECKKCQENMLMRRALLKKLGFKHPAMYMAWKKTHEYIKERMPLDKYNSIQNK